MLSALVPFGFAIASAAPSPQWSDDVALVRAAELLIGPGAGALTTLGLQGALLLPLGPQAFRGALLSAASLALVGALLTKLVRRLLDHLDSSPLNALLALSASLTATLAPTLLREGNAAGGACIATALGLSALLVHDPASRGEARPWLSLGALLALCAIESPSAAVATALALLAQGALLRPGGGKKGAWMFAVGVAAVVPLALLPALIRPSSPRVLLDLGVQGELSTLRALDVASLHSRGLGRWIIEEGISAFALCWLGALFGLLRKDMRWLVAPLLALLTLDVVTPTTNSGLLTSDPLSALRALALCAAAMLAALGVQRVALWLSRSKLPLAQPAAVLIVAFHATLAAISAEEGHAYAARSHNGGAEVWTEEALDRLPPQSLLLVRSDAIAMRLWSAAAVAGRRPDVLLVPLPLIQRGRLAASLIAQEPSLTPLLRDLSANGTPSEFALSQLADIRPVMVELDASWDRRLSTHVVPEQLWLRFSPQPIGQTDRRNAQAADATTFYRVAGAARRDEDAFDEGTLEVLATYAREQAMAAAIVGDKDAANRAVAQLTSLQRTPDDALAWLIDPSKKPEIRAETKPRSRRAR